MRLIAGVLQLELGDDLTRSRRATIRNVAEGMGLRAPMVSSGPRRNVCRCVRVLQGMIACVAVRFDIGARSACRARQQIGQT